MKVIWLLTIFALTVAAAPFEEQERVNGENGWYVPQLDGSFKWVNIDDVEANDAIEGRGISTNPVTFLLYTNANPNKGKVITTTDKSMQKSGFNTNVPTRIVIHGWTQTKFSGINKNIRNAWFSQGEFNVIYVDWGRANGEYALAVAAVSGVGQKTASLVDFLVKKYKLNLDDLIVIGHSLGAHVAGYTGKNVRSGKVGTIVGLDPALPLFNYNLPNKRLCDTDAKYVESIQTDGGQLGFLKPIGKGAFYPNGGKSQPGCPLDVTGACSHGRSVTYYAEAVQKNDFPTMKCANYEDATNKACGGTYSTVRMGVITNAYVVNGDYYVPVKSKSPYGMGN